MIESIVPVLDKLRALVVLGRITNDIFKNRLADILHTLGDGDFALAIQALKDASTSDYPSLELGFAIDRFERAHHNYTKAIAASNILQTLFETKKQVSMRRGAVLSLSLVVTTYRQLGNRSMMDQYAGSFRQEFLEYYDYVFYEYNDSVRASNASYIEALNKEELKAIEFLQSIGIQTWQPMQRKFVEKMIGPSEETRNMLRKW